MEEQKIRQLIEVEQKTLQNVSAICNTSIYFLKKFCADHKIVSKMGIPRRNWDIDQLRKWVEDDGLTHKVIGEKLGCANQTISKLCKQYGITAQRVGARSGHLHKSWKGGRALLKGYWYIYMPEHPHCTKKNRVAEHRIVMEKKIGRYLSPKEVVHHIDGDPLNNDVENLVLFRTNGDHLREELTGHVPKWTDAGYQKILEGALRKSIQCLIRNGDCRLQHVFPRLIA